MNKKMKYTTIVSVMIMLIPVFSMLVPRVNASGPAQPPIDTSTFWEGAIAWGPYRADPARAYDTVSGQLILNVYETLVAPTEEDYDNTKLVLASSFSRSSESLTGMVSFDLDVSTGTGSWIWDGETGFYVGFADIDGSGTVTVGDSIYVARGSGQNIAYTVTQIVNTGLFTLDVTRKLMIYGIRTSPVISFYDETGTPVDTMDADDVVYSFQRGLVQDQIGSPQWMFYKAFFGTMNSDPWDVDASTRVELAKLIDSAVSISAPNTVQFSLGGALPESAWNRTMDTWGNIVSKLFSMVIGCWDGDLFTVNGAEDPAWWDANLVRRKSRSPYDTAGTYRYAGTGPYHVAIYDPADLRVVLQRNPGWWQGWPIPGNGNAYSTGYVDTYEIDYIADWTTRKTAFLAGDIDTCAVPRAHMFELLQTPSTASDPILIGGKPVIKTIKNINPTLSMDAMLFTFNISEMSPYIGTGSFPDGIPTDFFYNTHVRRAFAYSFDPEQYDTTAWQDESNYRTDMFVTGLVPDFYFDLPGWPTSPASAEIELKNAVFDGQSVWSSGFTFTMLYNEGDEERRIACEMTKAFFQTLSTYNGRVGPPFTINIATTDWVTYLNLFEAQELPISDIGWLARYDFADADSFVRAYMHSNGYFAYIQGYTAANGWGNTKDVYIDQALVETNDGVRQWLYNWLRVKYYNDTPCYPLAIPLGRRWCQYWVKGWYYDALHPSAYDELYPATYIPSVYKYDDCWFDVTGPTLAVSDGITNMRDINYLIARFNARAPQPGIPIDSRWNGRYGGNGCVDPYGDRLCNMRDIQGAILHFNHKNNTGTP